MRHLYLLAVIFTFPLCGFYVGNPANPAIMSSGFFSQNYLVKGTSGYLYDYTTIKRYYATKIPPNFNPNAIFKQFGLHSQMGSLSLILVERLELFGYLGGSKEQIQGKPHPSTPAELESNYQFSGACGARAVLLQWGMVYLSGDFTYYGIPKSTKSFFRFFNPTGLTLNTGETPNTKQKTSINEWQISPAISSRFGFITPYIGALYLHSKLHIEENSPMPSIEYENKKKWGFYFGLTFSMTGKFHVNLERRLHNESGYSLATTAVF